jgi:hypothetical protein
MMLMEFNKNFSQQKSSIILGEIKCFFTALLMLILASNITGCSGGDAPPKSDLPSDTPGISTLSHDLVDTNTNIRTTTITKNNPGKIVINLSYNDGAPQVNKVVNVTTTKGTLYPADGMALTDTSGEAIINITAGDDIGVGKITVTVDEVGSAELNFEILEDTGTPGTAGGTVLTFNLVDSATGFNTTTITKNNPGEVAVNVSDANGNPLAREVVTVTTTKGALYPADGMALTDSSGQAVIGITANSQIGVGQITVTIGTNKSAPLNFEILEDASSGSSSTGATSVVTFDLVNSVTGLSTSTISSESPGQIKVNVKNTDGTPQIRKIVTVTTSKGTLYPADGMALTDSSGQAVIVISDNNAIGVGQIIVTVDEVASDPLYFEIISIETNILPNLLILTTSKTSVLSDNSDSATITATVVKDNVPLGDVPVKFSSTGGLMSDGSAITDAQGKAEINFNAGPDARNEVVSINASVSGLTDSTPIQITGNKLTLTSDQSNLGIGGNTDIAISLTNAVPLGIANKEITITLEETPVGAGPVIEIIEPSSAPLTTDYNGSAQIQVTGRNPGTSIIRADGMGATGTMEIVVTAPEDVFEITSPTPIEAGEGMATDETVDIVVNVPLKADGTPKISTVKFHTTLGCFDNGAAGCIGVGTSTKSVDVVVITDPITGTPSASAISTLGSGEAGTANINVSDPNDFNTFDNLQINFFAPPKEAYNITLQASQNVVAPSLGETKNALTLTAKVTTSDDQVVGEAIVDFTISNNPVGGGEQITPASVKTDSSGTATTTFYSGSKSSDSQGVTITAKIDGTSISTDVVIIIGGEAGSIVFGRSNKILSSPDDTYYTQDITVQVSDANGNPVVGAVVTLNLWPTAYYLGFESASAQSETGSEDCYFYNDWPKCSGIYPQANEDANMNLVRDPGEDTGPYDLNSGTMQADGLLTPHNSAAGSIPPTVTTDENGLAGFPHTFLKQYALWVKVRLKASVMVLATETQATSSWMLPGEKEEIETCDLFDSPFGYYVPTLFADAGADQAVLTNSTVQLDGMSSPAECAQTWEWSFTKVPEGSNVTDDSLSNPTITNPTFTPDLAGVYILKLTAGSSGVTVIDTVTITAS